MNLKIFLAREFRLVRNVIVLAAGGSGGHIFPAQALAENLLKRGWDVILITDVRGVAYTSDFPKKVEKFVLKISNPSAGGIYSSCISLLYLSFSIFSVARYIRRIRATMVIGFGGYPTAPSMVAAQLLRIPSVIHEQNSVLGRVNNIFKNRVKFVAFGLKPYTLKSSKEKALITGNPVRKIISDTKVIKYSSVCKGKDKFNILVLGGSQGASFVSHLVSNALIDLPKELREQLLVINQCRKEDIVEVKNRYRLASVEALTKPFFENISDRLNNANLVISRSGASTLAEICIFGRPSILIPLRSAVGNHQLYNARVMEAGGASIVLDESELELKKLKDSISQLMNDRQKLNKMANSALKLGKPNAAENIADEIEKLRF